MQTNYQVSVKYLVTGTLSLLLCVVCAMAQLTNEGTIVGTVTDQTGAEIPGAKVTVTNLGTNIQQVAETDAAGQYVVPSLKVGNYSVTVEKPGFQSFVQTGIDVEVQSRVQIDA